MPSPSFFSYFSQLISYILRRRLHPLVTVSKFCWVSPSSHLRHFRLRQRKNTVHFVFATPKTGQVPADWIRRSRCAAQTAQAAQFGASDTGFQAMLIQNSTRRPYSNVTAKLEYCVIERSKSHNRGLRHVLNQHHSDTFESAALRYSAMLVSMSS